MIQSFTIIEAKQKIAAGEITSKALTEACLERIKKQNGALNAFIQISETALKEAESIDVKRAAGGQELGVLAGIPIAVKANMLAKGLKATAGSRILENYVAPYDATVVERLRAAGAIILGVTNMDEFAMGSSTETSHFGQTHNPWNQTKVPGGSSGGSAAAVAADFVPGAFGSDTGGSIRQPASLCGVVGLKPTYGRVSRYGLMAMASSLDQIGPFARTVEDAALLLQVVEGDDPKDATTVAGGDTTGAELISEDVGGLRIGLPKEYFLEGMEERIRTSVFQAVEVLQQGGADVHEISLPHAEYALAAYYIIMPCESSSNLGRFDGMRYGYAASSGRTLMETYERSRGEGFGSEVKRRIMLGSYALSKGYYDAYYKKALQVRMLIRRDFDEVFKHVDAILTPTSPSVAW